QIKRMRGNRMCVSGFRPVGLAARESGFYQMAGIARATQTVAEACGFGEASAPSSYRSLGRIGERRHDSRSFGAVDQIFGVFRQDGIWLYDSGGGAGGTRPSAWEVRPRSTPSPEV